MKDDMATTGCTLPAMQMDKQAQECDARMQHLITEGLESGVAEDFSMRTVQAALDKR